MLNYIRATNKFTGFFTARATLWWQRAMSSIWWVKLMCFYWNNKPRQKGLFSPHSGLPLFVFSSWSHTNDPSWIKPTLCVWWITLNQQITNVNYMFQEQNYGTWNDEKTLRRHPTLHHYRAEGQRGCLIWINRNHKVGVHDSRCLHIVWY